MLAVSTPQILKIATEIPQLEAIALLESGTHWKRHTKQGIEWNVYLGQSRQVLANLPSDTFDCVMTSPPYFWLRDYGVKDQIGLEETVQQYVDSIADVMDEVFRVLSPTGLLFLNIGDTYYSGKGESHGRDPKNSKRRFGLRAVDKSGGLGIGLERKSLIGIPWRVVAEMSSRKWVLRSPIIWSREANSSSEQSPKAKLKRPSAFLAESVTDRPRRTYEHVFMFAKSRRYYFNRVPLIEAAEEDIWRIAARPKTTNGLNTAPFPDELVERCLEIGCQPNGKVLDPFAGSGTTLRVALRSGRSATGIDLNSDCCYYMLQQLAKI